MALQRLCHHYFQDLEYGHLFFFNFPSVIKKFLPILFWFSGVGWTGWGWSVDCQGYFTLCLVSRVSDSLIPLYPALLISPRFVPSVSFSLTE